MVGKVLEGGGVWFSVGGSEGVVDVGGVCGGRVKSVRSGGGGVKGG